jgi:hypothetical protein
MEKMEKRKETVSHKIGEIIRWVKKTRR